MNLPRMLTLSTILSLCLFSTTSCRLLSKDTKPVEIHIQSQFAENAAQLPSVKSLADAVKRFNETHENIHVTIDYATNMTGVLSFDEIDDKLAGEQPPDIVSYSPGTRLNAAESKGLLKEMSNLEGIYELGIPQNIMNSAMVNGKLMMIPTEIYPSVVWLNTTLFSKAGETLPEDDWTWEQFSRLSRSDANNKQTPLIPYDLPSLMTLLASAGKQPLSPDGTTTVGYLDSPEAVKAIQYLNRYYRDFQFALPVDPITVYGNFNFSETSLYVSGLNANFTSFAGAQASQLDFAFLPHFEGTPQVRPVGMGGYAISARCKDPEAAWTVIRYLAFEPEGDTSLIGKTSVPTTPLLADYVRQNWGDKADDLLALLSDSMFLTPFNDLLYEAVGGTLKLQFESLLKIEDDRLPSAMHDLALAVDEEMARLREQKSK